MVRWYDGMAVHLSWDRFLIVLEEHDDGLQRDVQVRQSLLRAGLRVVLAHHLGTAAPYFQCQPCCVASAFVSSFRATFSAAFSFPLSLALSFTAAATASANATTAFDRSSAGVGRVARRLDERVRLYLVLQVPHRLQQGAQARAFEQVPAWRNDGVSGGG